MAAFGEVTIKWDPEALAVLERLESEIRQLRLAASGSCACKSCKDFIAEIGAGNA